MAFGGLKKWLEDRAKNVGSVASRTYDQVNPFDSGRSFTTRTPTQPVSPTQPVNQEGYKYSPLAQRDPEQRAFETYTQQYRQGKIQKPRYDALIKSLGRKEALYNDVPKAWTDQYRSGKISEQRYDALLKQQVGRKAPQAEGINAFTRVTAPIALGAMRGATGIAQGVSGLYDLATPGHGTNRFSQNLDTIAKATDYLVDNTGLSKGAYLGSQVAANLVPLGVGTKAAQAATQGTKLGNAAGRYNNFVTNRMAPTVQNTLTRAHMPTIGRAAGYGTRHGLTATDLAQDAVLTASQIGQDASKGIEITPQRIATEAALIGVANPVGAAAMGGAGRLVRAGAEGVSKAPLKLKQTTAKRALQKAARSLTPEDRAIYEGIYRLHNDPTRVPVQEQNFLIAAGRNLDKKYGIDTSISGSRADFKQRIENLIDESMKPQRQSLLSDQRGSVQVPGKKPERLYHGGAGVGEMRKNGIKILSPEEKLKYPSSGGGYVGLSTSSDKAYAQQFSKAIAGSDDVLELQIKPNARVLELPEGKAIDDMSADELTKLSSKYDVIKSVEDNEYRILNDSAILEDSSLPSNQKGFISTDPNKSPIIRAIKKLASDEGGFVKVPGKDPLESLRAEARKYKSVDPKQNTFTQKDAQIMAAMQDSSPNVVTDDNIRQFAISRNYNPDDFLKAVKAHSQFDANGNLKADRTPEALAAKRASEAVERRKSNIESLGDFTKGMTNLNKERVAKILSKEVRYDGAKMTKREVIEKLASDESRISRQLDKNNYRIVRKNDTSTGVTVSKTEFDYFNHIRSKAPKTKGAVRPKDVPSYVPDDKVDAYLKSDDYLKDQRFNKMASETKSGDPFDHPDMYENPTPEMQNNLKAPQPTKGASPGQKADPTQKAQPKATQSQTGQLQPTSPRGNKQEPSQYTPRQESGVFSHQSTQSSNSQGVSSSFGVKNTTKAPIDKELESLASTAPRNVSFDAVATSSQSNKLNTLVDGINADNKITRAAKQAQESGREAHFFAKKDASGRSVGIEQFNPQHHRIEAGFVVDSNNNVLGNHIKVDSTGIQVNVGGDLVNMSRVLGNVDEWGNKYRVSETMSRNIDRNAPGGKNGKVAKAAKEYIIGGKVKAEANYRVELQAEYKKLGDRIKTTEKARPSGVSKKQWLEDIFDSLDGKLSDSDIKTKYGSDAKAILEYKKQTRDLYDSLFERINTERIKFGQRPIDKRKDYITHLNELSGDKNFVGDVYNSLRNSITDEGMQKSRGGVPGQIAGRTENFSPKSAYNRFLQRRTGDKALKDPFRAVQEYLEPALYNIHMTEATVRARAVEAAFRTAGELKTMSANDVVGNINKLAKKYGGGDNGKLVAGFQEYANALAKKTQRWDRQIIDASEATARGLKEWQRLQRISGRATIVGNVSSILAQPLNQVITLADAGPINYMRGVFANLGGDEAIKKSAFINARQTKAVAPIRKTGTKILDVGGVPLEAVEMAAVKNTWHAMHAKAKRAGLKGMEAIQKADFDTERLVAGRGIADRPEAYRSTLTNGLLQFTLEVSAQNKAFWQDLTVSQKATFIVAAAGVNSIMGQVTGFEPLPDFLGAAVDTAKDLANPNDERSTASKVVGGAQAMAGEYASMNPFFSAVANTLMTQDQRKAVFGSESDLGRFSGTSSPVQVLKNAYRAAESALEGNWTDARNNALRNVPYGNQARKTITGHEANQRGYAVTRGGDPTYATSENPIRQIQNLLFGPSSTPEAREYYGNSQRPITQNQAEKVRNSSDPRSEVRAIQSNRMAARGAGNIPEMTTDQREKYEALPESAKADFALAVKEGRVSSAGKVSASEDDAVGQAQNAILRTKAKLPADISKESERVLTRYSRLSTEGKEKFNSDPKKVFERELAEYERDTLLGKVSSVDRVVRERNLGKLKIASDLNIDKDTSSLYGWSKARIEDFVKNDPNGQALYSKLVAYDNALYNAGLIDKPKFRNGLGSGRGGGGGSKTALKSAISTASSAGTAKPIVKVASGSAPSGKLSVPAIRTANRAKAKTFRTQAKKIAKVV